MLTWKAIYDILGKTKSKDLQIARENNVVKYNFFRDDFTSTAESIRNDDQVDFDVNVLTS